jgi:ribosome-associated heat shock protein Hsp15
MAGTPEGPDRVRLDKWLWAARFFKTRALASEAIAGGKVHANDARVKPSRPVKPGDALRIRKGPYTFDVTVHAVSGRRGPAGEAAKLYEETEASRLKRETLAAERRAERLSRPEQSGRPGKRDRRLIHRFTGRGRS